MAKDKDLFEEIMEEEEPIEDENVDIEGLKEELAALQKEKHGLLEAVKSERKSRQELQRETSELKGRFNAINNTVDKILEQRQPTPAVPQQPKGIPIDFDEEGDGYLNPDTLKPLFAERDQKINELLKQNQRLEQELQLASGQQRVNQEVQNTLNAIVGEDERYGAAATKYRAARNWVEARVLEYAQDKGITDVIPSGQALDEVFDESLEEEFNNRFGNIPLDSVVVAEDSYRQYRNMLKTIANATAEPTPQVTGNPSQPVTKRDPKTGKFTKVLSKPSGLGNTTNAKGGELSVIEKLDQLSNSDVENLTDAQVKAIEDAIRQDELTDGITW